jgi:hypothetical protein
MPKNPKLRALSGGEDPQKPSPKALMAARADRTAFLSPVLRAALQEAPSDLIARQMQGQDPAPAPTSGREAAKKQTWTDDELFDFKDSQGTHTGKYPIRHLRGVVQAARATGQDPYEAAAFVLQESSLGLNGKRNLGYTYQAPSDAQLKEMADLSAKTGIELRYLEPLILYRDKLAEAKRLGYTDRAKQIQVYNGDKLLTRENANADRAYGVPIPPEGIHLGKNPLYGKRVLQLAEDMRRNPYLRSLLAGESAVAGR